MSDYKNNKPFRKSALTISNRTFINLTSLQKYLFRKYHWKLYKKVKFRKFEQFQISAHPTTRHIWSRQRRGRRSLREWRDECQSSWRTAVDGSRVSANYNIKKKHIDLVHSTNNKNGNFLPIKIYIKGPSYLAS